MQKLRRHFAFLLLTFLLLNFYPITRLYFLSGLCNNGSSSALLDVQDNGFTDDLADIGAAFFGIHSCHYMAFGGVARFSRGLVREFAAAIGHSLKSGIASPAPGAYREMDIVEGTGNDH